MKKLFLFSLLVLLISSLFAQERGDMLISGSLSWTSNSIKNKFDNESQVLKGDRSFSFVPQFHYFVADKFAVGLGIGYSLTKEPNENKADNDDQLFDKTNLFIVRPMASYYVSLGEKFYYVPRFYVGFGVGKYKKELDNNTTADADISSFAVGLYLLNFEFRPSDKIGIMFNAGDLTYQTVTAKVDDNKLTNRDFNLGLNLGATIGFNFYF